MAWVFVGVSSVVEVTAASHPLVTTGITGLAAGDLLVACISSRIASTTSVTLPTGGEWTLVGEQKTNNILTTGSAVPSGVMAYCVRGASNPNLTFTHPTAPSVALGRIVAYRSVNTSSPKDTQTSFTTATATTAVSGTGLTTTQAEDLIVAMAAGGQEAAWTAFNATSPAGASSTASQTGAPTTTWLERADSLTTTGVDTSLAIFDAVKTTTGATGNLTATASVSAAHVIIAGAFKIAPPPTSDTVGSASGIGAASGVGISTLADAWSASDKSANITLSNNDKTAALTTNVLAGVRSSQKRANASAGKYYFEFLIESLASPFNVRVGLSSTAQSLTTTTNALHCHLNDGAVSVGGSILVYAWTDGAPVAGDVICFAWDAGGEDISVRKNNGHWNNSPSSDPATGVGSFNASAMPAGDYALWFNATESGRSVTVRTEAAEFTYSGPSGFTSWMGEALATTSNTVGEAAGIGAAIGGGAATKETSSTTTGGVGAANGVGTDGAVVATAGDGTAAGIGAASGAGAAPTNANAWNRADKSANISLTNGEKTATLNAAVTSGVRSTTKYLNGTETGKFYVEFFLTNVVGSISNQVGIRETSASLTSTAGSTAQCASNSGNILTGNATIIGNVGGSPLADGDVICMAWSPSTERIWFRKNSGLWNNDAAANPSTNTNGLDISVLNNTDHALFFLIASTGNGASTSIRTEAAELTYTAPSGFTSWMGEALGPATSDTVGSASGIGAATADGATFGTTTAAASGIGAAAADGRQIVPATTSTAAGLGAASGAGAQTAATTAFGTGTATAAAAGDKLATAAALASGLGAANGAGAHIAAATAAASGIGAAAAIGSTTSASGVGAAYGVGSAIAVTGDAVITASDGTASGIGTAAAVGEDAGEVVQPPVSVGRGYYAPPRPYPVEGTGYGILPELVGEAHGVVAAVGAGVGVLPQLIGAADGSAGVAGRSTARLIVKATASGDRGQVCTATAVLECLAGSGSGAAGAHGCGSGVLVTIKGAARGRHDDDEAAVITFLMAA